MAQHNDMGRWGEEQAARYLEAKGYGIMARNWRSGHRDIDIVAHRGGTVVFVEVKTRRSLSLAAPEQAVGARKVRSVVAAAGAFVRSRGIDADVRFDIITVTGEPGAGCDINHIEDAFMPMP